LADLGSHVLGETHFFVNLVYLRDIEAEVAASL
jgi:hypothetical protein